jgi:ATP-dependent exoDNAse (exonuclease V) beta subunit
MLFFNDDSLVIIDFKTDSITHYQIDERANFYHPQLLLYAKAAQKILNRKNAASFLYFLTSASAVKIT